MSNQKNRRKTKHQTRYRYYYRRPYESFTLPFARNLAGNRHCSMSCIFNRYANPSARKTLDHRIRKIHRNFVWNKGKLKTDKKHYIQIISFYMVCFVDAFVAFGVDIIKT